MVSDSTRQPPPPPPSPRPEPSDTPCATNRPDDAEDERLREWTHEFHQSIGERHRQIAVNCARARMIVIFEEIAVNCMSGECVDVRAHASVSRVFETSITTIQK